MVCIVINVVGKGFVLMVRCGWRPPNLADRLDNIRKGKLTVLLNIALRLHCFRSIGEWRPA